MRSTRLPTLRLLGFCAHSNFVWLPVDLYHVRSNSYRTCHLDRSARTAAQFGSVTCGSCVHCYTVYHSCTNLLRFPFNTTYRPVQFHLFLPVRCLRSLPTIFSFRRALYPGAVLPTWRFRFTVPHLHLPAVLMRFRIFYRSFCLVLVLPLPDRSRFPGWFSSHSLVRYTACCLLHRANSYALLRIGFGTCTCFPLRHNAVAAHSVHAARTLQVAFALPRIVAVPATSTTYARGSFPRGSREKRKHTHAPYVRTQRTARLRHCAPVRLVLPAHCVARLRAHVLPQFCTAWFLPVHTGLLRLLPPATVAVTPAFCSAVLRFGFGSGSWFYRQFFLPHHAHLSAHLSACLHTAPVTFATHTCGSVFWITSSHLPHRFRFRYVC